MLAALIGSWVDQGALGAPEWMLGRAAEYMYANEEELVIRIGGMTITPSSLVEQFRMHQTLFDMAAYPRLLLNEVEVALHGLAGGLDKVIEVYAIPAKIELDGLCGIQLGRMGPPSGKALTTRSLGRLRIGQGNLLLVYLTGRGEPRLPGTTRATWKIRT